MPKITIEQHDVARILARSYGHRWATERDAPSALAYTDGARYSGEGIDTEQISRAARADAMEGTIGGIFAPETADANILGYRDLGAVPVVVHATCTRRLRWHILPSGAANLFVSRPDGESEEVVLTATIAEDRRIASIVVGSHESIRAHARHWMALLEALTPLVGTEAAWAEVLPRVGAEIVLCASFYAGRVLWTLADTADKWTTGVPSPRVFPVGVASLEEAFGMLRVQS